MSDQQVKEFFSSVLEGGPADRLDLDRAVAAGRRRRRIRTATTLASAAAVLVVVGALVVSALPDGGRADLGGVTASPSPSLSGNTVPSPTMGPDVVVSGTPEDWMRALTPYLPPGTQTPAVTTTHSMNLGIVRAAFRYTADGRTTALVVTAYSPGDRSFEQAYNALQESCSIGGLTCETTAQTPSGPVLVRRADDGTELSVSSVRANGVVVTVDSWNGDTDADRVLPGSGAPGFSTEEQVAALVEFAAAVPLPASVLPSPTPTPGPSTDAPTLDPTPTPTLSGSPIPQPTPTGTDPVTEPTPTPTPKPAGLIGAYASEACERQQTYEYRVPRPIAGSVIEYVVCPHESGGTLVPSSVSPQSGAAFDDLDAALRQPGQPKADACRLKLDIQRPIFVRTNDGWFKVEQPTDGCGNRQPELLDAVTAIVGTAA